METLHGERPSNSLPFYMKQRLHDIFLVTETKRKHFTVYILPYFFMQNRLGRPVYL